MATVEAVQPGNASSTAESYSHVERITFAVFMIVSPLIQGRRAWRENVRAVGSVEIIRDRQEPRVQVL
jgi:hypothetical protein